LCSRLAPVVNVSAKSLYHNGAKSHYTTKTPLIPQI